MKTEPTVVVSKEAVAPDAPTFNSPGQALIKMPCKWLSWLMVALLTLLGYAYSQYEEMKAEQSSAQHEIRSHGNTLKQMIELSKQVNEQAIDIAEIKRDVSGLVDDLKDQRGDIKELLRRAPQTPTP